MVKFRAPSPKLRSQSVELGLANDSKRGQPIVIRFGYQWHKDGDQRADIWPCVREAVNKVLAECGKIREQREGGERLKLSFGRLRARHGTTVIGSIVSRIRQADILIFDLGDFNRNVLFELGCAVGHHGVESENIYVLGTQATRKKAPSDLVGLVYSQYRRDGAQGACQFEELRPFQTTLRGSITKLAQKRGMWGELRKKSEVEDEEVPC